MKVISNHKELNKEFKRLSEQYSKYYWAVAWASTSNTQFEFLQANQHKIENIVVGLHFYQTHPEFIKAFLSHKGVKFIKQPEGTFHPKVYLFFDNNSKWELIMGSANFTDAAFSKNCEANILITSEDNEAADVLKSILALVKSSWNDGSYFDKAELQDYERVWKNQQQKINSLSGLYGGTKIRSKQFFNSPIAKMTWDDYAAGVHKDKRGNLEKRLELLTEIRKMFEREAHFSKLLVEERKFIAGMPNKHPLSISKKVDSGWFGSMKPALTFKKEIILNNLNISNALDQIPLNGQVTEADYFRFVELFKEISNKKFVAPASRLLAMKRPDVFVCVDGMNKKKLCSAFGIVQTKMTYERYWTDIIASIIDSHWWQNPKPVNEFDKNISLARAAFLDSLYYEYK
jgi:hypothetical protein